MGLKFTNHPVEFSDVVLNLLYMCPLEMPHLFCQGKTFENLLQLTFSPPEKRGFSASDTSKRRAPYATSRDLIPELSPLHKKQRIASPSRRGECQIHARLHTPPCEDARRFASDLAQLWSDVTWSASASHPLDNNEGFITHSRDSQCLWFTL